MFNKIKLSEKNTKKLLSVLQQHNKVFKNRASEELYEIISYQVN